MQEEATASDKQKLATFPICVLATGSPSRGEVRKCCLVDSVYIYIVDGKSTPARGCIAVMRKELWIVDCELWTLREASDVAER